MGILDGIKNFQERRALERELRAQGAAWETAVNAAIKDGAKYEKSRSDGGEILVTLDDVPEKHWSALERVWFKRLHSDSKLFMCQGPPQANARATGRPYVTNRGQRRAVGGRR